jgi:hypothetical protein
LYDEAGFHQELQKIDFSDLSVCTQLFVSSGLEEKQLIVAGLNMFHSADIKRVPLRSGLSVVSRLR